MAENNIAQYGTTGASVGALGGPAGAAIGAGAGLLVGAGQYLWNKNQAKKDERNRSLYQIPAEVQAGFDETQRQALIGLPDAQKQQYISNLQRGQAYSLNRNQTRKGGLVGVAALNEQQNQGYANLLAQDSAARMQNQKQVYGQLDNLANYKGQQFQLNQSNPYYEKMARDQANRGSLFQNVTKGAQLGMYAGSQGQQKSFQPQQNNNLTPQEMGQSISDQSNPSAYSYAPSVSGYRSGAQELGWDQ